MGSSAQNGIVAFVLSAVLLSFLIGPTTCSDGWHSPSIGRQGACSWHGGVNHTPQFLVFLASAFIGVVAYAVSNWREQKRLQELQDIIRGEAVSEAVPIDNEAQEKLEKLREFVKNRTGAGKNEIGPTCPLCGSAMKKRLAKRGPRRGKYFFGCSHYPVCRGTRNVG